MTPVAGRGFAAVDLLLHLLEPLVGLAHIARGRVQYTCTVTWYPRPMGLL